VIREQRIYKSIQAVCLISLAISLTVLLVSSLQCEDAEVYYKVTPLFFVLPSELHLLENTMETPDLNEETIIGYLTGRESHSISDSNITLNELKMAIENRSGTVLSTPKSLSRPGNPVLTFAQFPCGYFEKDETGSYQLKTLDLEESPGVLLQSTFTRQKKDSLYLEFNFKITLVKERIRIPHVPFDVGKPVLESIEAAGDANLHPGVWQLLGIASMADVDSETEELIVVLIRIDEYRPKKN